jgi:hypothetical protein
MAKPVPTYEDATLVLKLYELRREERLRAAREWFVRKFHPTTIEEIRAVQSASTEENVSWRMVTTYWEMAASFVTRGILNPDLFLDSGGEMLVMFTKLEPFLSQIRTAPGADLFLSHVEKLVKSSPRAQDRVLKIRDRIAKQRTAAGAAQ